MKICWLVDQIPVIPPHTPSAANGIAVQAIAALGRDVETRAEPFMSYLR